MNFAIFLVYAGLHPVMGTPLYGKLVAEVGNEVCSTDSKLGKSTTMLLVTTDKVSST